MGGGGGGGFESGGPRSSSGTGGAAAQQYGNSMPSFGVPFAGAGPGFGGQQGNGLATSRLMQQQQNAGSPRQSLGTFAAPGMLPSNRVVGIGGGLGAVEGRPAAGTAARQHSAAPAMAYPVGMVPGHQMGGRQASSAAEGLPLPGGLSQGGSQAMNQGERHPQSDV
jgi:hypothetical protein